MKNKTQLELEYELRFTKKFLKRLMELNKDKELVTPDESELDLMEKELKDELERLYPKYKIHKK